MHLVSGGLAFSTFFLRLILVNWYVLEKTDSSFIVGLFGSIPVLVQPLISPLGGKFADQYSRKHILFITRIIETLISNIGGFYKFKYISFMVNWWNFIICWISRRSKCTVMEKYVSRYIGIRKCCKGNAVTELINGLINSILPPLAAILLTIFTVSELYWSLPLVSYFSGLLIFIMVIKLPNQKILENTDDSSLSESIKYVFKNNSIRPILILGSSLVIWGITQPLIPVYCRDYLNLDGTGYSLMTTTFFCWEYGWIDNINSNW